LDPAYLMTKVPQLCLRALEIGHAFFKIETLTFLFFLQCSTVGIGGHITHGGFGFSSRAWGLAMDHIYAMDVVLANGSIVHVMQDMNADIYYVRLGSQHCS
jgi:FAD/FMN-containing dehydrogenase